ncbi:MAG TPA: mechanosensitive ion channel domain-containing protein, partial [Candidatus Angelobacter sp.]
PACGIDFYLGEGSKVEWDRSWLNMHRRGFSVAWLFCRRALVVAGVVCLVALSATPPAASGSLQPIGTRDLPTQQGESKPSAVGAPVQLDGRNVLEVRWGYKTFTPAARAAHISQLLKRLGDDPSAPALSVQPEAGTVDVMSGETLVAAVFDGDAKAAGVAKEALAQQWATAMQRAVDAYRAEHSLRLKLERLALVLLIIVICVAGLAVFRALARQLAKRAHAMLDDRAARTDKRFALFLSHERTHHLVQGTLNFTRFVLSLIVVWGSLRLLLSIFPSTRPFSEKMRESVLHPVQDFAKAFLASLPSLVFVVLVLIVTWYATRLIHFFFTRIREGEISLEGFRPVWAPTTDRLVNIALIILAVLVAYPYIPGAESPAFKGVSLFLGVLVSLGSTGLVANAVNGMSLTYLDAFEVGDLVKIGDVVGWITKMGMLTTRVRTRKNEIITIPNSVVMNKEIINYNKPGDEGVIVSSKVGIGYDAPWRQVEGMLLLAARRTRGVRANPAPFVLELSLNTFDITYEVNTYLEPGQLEYVVTAELNRNILDAFNEFGVQIMTPAYIADPQQDKVVPREQWHRPPATPLDASDATPGDSKAAD